MIVFTRGPPKLGSVPILTSNQEGRQFGKTEFSHLDFHLCTKKTPLRDFLVGPGVKTACFPLQGAQVPSLVRELRSCMLHGMAKKVKKKLKTESCLQCLPPHLVVFSCSVTSLPQEMLSVSHGFVAFIFYVCLIVSLLHASPWSSYLVSTQV